MKQGGLLFIIVLAVTLVLGCAPLRQPAPAADPEQLWQARQEVLRESEAWRLKGRAVIDAIEEVWTGTLHWRQQGEEFEIRWVAPLGQGSIELRGDPAQVTLRAPKEQPVTAASAENLLQLHVGWSLPVSGLRYWLLGLPAPELPVANLSLDSSGRVLRLSQGGWQIRYLEYSSVKKYDLPGKLFFDNPRLRLRLVIDRWELG
jgi:outer membrane lipoprotein LolB